MAPRSASAAVGEETQVSHNKKPSSKPSFAVPEPRWDANGLPIFPTEPPQFTLADIRAAIPPHCFKRSTLTSLRFILQDCAISYGLFHLACTFLNETYIPSLWVRALLWPVWWYTIGCVMTGMWVEGHEGGHSALSDYAWFNNGAGALLHSFLLVPYFSWKYSHAAHHKNTNSCEHDEVFVPRRRSELRKTMSMSLGETFSDTPIANALGVLSILVFGWPLYLTLNATGPTKYDGKAKSHFNPLSALFTDKQRLWVVLSDVGFFAMVGVLLYWLRTYGFAAVFFYYLAPLIVVNSHLVGITFLQHTDVNIPHFSEKEFTWLRGALCTVDRSWSWVLDRVFHRITDTHVCHHLFSTMPFYHAAEATEAIKKVVGGFYLRDETPVPIAAMRAWSQCRFLEDGEDIAFFKNAKDWEEGEKAWLAKKKGDHEGLAPAGKKRAHSKARQ